VEDLKYNHGFFWEGMDRNQADSLRHFGSSDYGAFGSLRTLNWFTDTAETIWFRLGLVGFE
jgi:hypothetical protein